MGLGSWAYFTSDNPSVTALIPVIFGVILLAINSGVKNEEKIRSHVAVVLTLLIIFGLISPLKGAIERGSMIGTIRVALMLLSSIVAMVFFVKSFIDVRKARKAGATEDNA